jgi:hypothetical protein
MPANRHVRFGGGPHGKGPANSGRLAMRPTQPFGCARLVDSLMRSRIAHSGALCSRGEWSRVWRTMPVCLFTS